MTFLSVFFSPAEVRSNQRMGATRLLLAERLGMVSLSIALAILLGIAAWMQPNPRGLGTHQQLGLPPCTFLWISGVRCPACGMTTSWAHMLDGRVFQSIQSNCGGSLLCVLAMVASPMCAYLAWRGTATKQHWFSGLMIVGLLLALGIAILEWILRITVIDL